jgi:hypothetical protein
MSANRLFIVCSHHTNLADAFCIGERGNSEGQYKAPNLKRLDDWYEKHQGCGRGCDHFQLAYHRTRDWDVSPPAAVIDGTVRLELAKAGMQ